jgi:hypothetical protein
MSDFHARRYAENPFAYLLDRGLVFVWKHGRSNSEADYLEAARILREETKDFEARCQHVGRLLGLGDFEQETLPFEESKADTKADAKAAREMLEVLPRFMRAQVTPEVSEARFLDSIDPVVRNARTAYRVFHPFPSGMKRGKNPIAALRSRVSELLRRANQEPVAAARDYNVTYVGMSLIGLLYAIRYAREATAAAIQRSSSRLVPANVATPPMLAKRALDRVLKPVHKRDESGKEKTAPPSTLQEAGREPQRRTNRIPAQDGLRIVGVEMEDDDAIDLHLTVEESKSAAAFDVTTRALHLTRDNFLRVAFNVITHPETKRRYSDNSAAEDPPPLDVYFLNPTDLMERILGLGPGEGRLKPLKTLQSALDLFVALLRVSWTYQRIHVRGNRRKLIPMRGAKMVTVSAVRAGAEDKNGAPLRVESALPDILERHAMGDTSWVADYEYTFMPAFVSQAQNATQIPVEVMPAINRLEHRQGNRALALYQDLSAIIRGPKSLTDVEVPEAVGGVLTIDYNVKRAVTYIPAYLSKKEQHGTPRAVRELFEDFGRLVEIGVLQSAARISNDIIRVEMLENTSTRKLEEMREQQEGGRDAQTEPTTGAEPSSSG